MYKHLLLVSVFAFGSLMTEAQKSKVESKVAPKQSEVAQSEGIVFFKGTWEEALAESKKSGKPIFLDTYAPWCGPCKLLDKRVFSRPQAGEFFNANFVCVKLDVDSKEIDGKPNPAVGVGEKLGVTAYPTLFILNADGTVKKKSVGFLDVDALIEFGKSGL